MSADIVAAGASRVTGCSFVYDLALRVRLGLLEGVLVKEVPAFLVLVLDLYILQPLPLLVVSEQVGRCV